MSKGISYSASGAALFALGREIEKARLLEPLPVSPGRLSILRLLAQAGPATASDLARGRGGSRQAVQRLADDLCRLGWVEKAPNPRNRRAPRLTLTEAGHGAFRSLQDQETQHLNTLAEGLDPAALQAARRLLASLRERSRGAVRSRPRPGR